MDLFQIADDLDQISLNGFVGEFMLFAVASELPSFWVIDGEEELGTAGKKWLMLDGDRIAEADFHAHRVEWMGDFTARKAYTVAKHRLWERMIEAASAIEEDIAASQKENMTYKPRPPCGKADQLGRRAESLRERADNL